MKNRLPSFVYGLAFVTFFVSCSQANHPGNVNLTISESGHQYKIVAHYSEENTAGVAAYMNRKLGKGSMSFANTKIDAKLTLDNGTRLYMKNFPGDLEIAFDKEENSIAAYKEIKAFGDGLKPMLQQ